MVHEKQRKEWKGKKMNAVSMHFAVTYIKIHHTDDPVARLSLSLFDFSGSTSIG